MPPERVAVAISGGGYRASAWGLGVLWAAVHADISKKVTVVASVSGGSVTNAQTALGKPYQEICATDFATQAKPLLGRLAGRPAVWRWSIIVTVLAAITAAVLIGLDNPSAAAVAGAVALLASLAGTGSGDLLFNRVETWLYVDLLLGLVCVVVWAWPNPLAVSGAVLLLGTVALARGPVVGWSMGRSIRTLYPRRDHTLGGMNPEPSHVFLATELRAGHHVAFARNFVYCHDLGLGAKPSLPVRLAVQASSNLPGAFPTRWARTAGMGLVGGNRVGWLALSDGGDYDNMGDQWSLGLEERIERLNKVKAVKSDPPARAILKDWGERIADFVIVGNASGALGFRKVWTGAIPLIGELLGLLQVKDVLYDNGNSVRRQRLIDWFDAGTPSGTLIHITSSPYMLPCVWPDRERADAATKWLDAAMTKAEWNGQVAIARAVGTQLWPVGRAKAEAVVRTAYAQTMVNLHLKLGTPLPDPPTLTL